MNTKKVLTHKKLVWVNNEKLAMALVANDHSLYKTFYDMFSKQLEWLFVDTPQLNKDIEKYRRGRLWVNAGRYDVLITGSQEP